MSNRRGATGAKDQAHMKTPIPLVIVLLGCLALTGCGEEQPAQTEETVEMPTFEDDRLMAGRSVWRGTCRACHLRGVAGAPAVTNFAEWERRLAKGKPTLYQSALSGIRGEDGKYRMPPRGGNDRLSEEQIRLAVDYKVAAIERLMEQQAQP